MKQRNPLFVAGFPYATAFVGYVGLRILVGTSEGNPDSTAALVGLLIMLALLLVGAGYFYYWLVYTARVMRREAQAVIPNALLLIVPLANLWWMWRFSQGVELYTKTKMQGALAFVLVAGAGSIGAGILQDTFNKQLAAPSAPTQPQV